MNERLPRNREFFFRYFPAEGEGGAYLPRALKPRATALPEGEVSWTR
jgi:hypothetical protein